LIRGRGNEGDGVNKKKGVKMTKITSSIVKKLARDLGADVVGIASVDRFKGAPPGHSPQDLMPESQSVIVAGIRIPDTVVEYDRYHLKMEDMPQDTAIPSVMENFYMQMGHYTIDIALNFLAVMLANKIEIGWGLRALPTPDTINTGLGRSGGGPLRGFFSQRHAATRAGLGEFGFSGLVLTPQFGPRVRFVSVITEAELEPDPLITEKICFRGICGGKDGPKCFQRCADGALQLREGIDRNAIFIDIPSRTDISKCIRRGGDAPAGFACTFVGTCMRECPNGMKVTKKRSATQ
jgi:epoxyqueuosine reductase